MKTRTMMSLVAIGTFAASTTIVQAQVAAKLGDSPGVVLSQYDGLTAGSAIYASDREDEAGELLLRRVWPLSHCWSGHRSGINQYEGHPPEWGQDARVTGQRFDRLRHRDGKHHNTLCARESAPRRYVVYRCECKGFFPRLDHAVISTFISRRGDDGHRVFSFTALVAPYAGTMTAVYAWYPRTATCQRCLSHG